MKEINTGVPQGNVLVTFADDTDISAVGNDCHELKKLNEAKSVHVNYMNKNVKYMPVRINNTKLLYTNEEKYIGITLEAKLLWKTQVKKEWRRAWNKKMYWLSFIRSYYCTNT